MEDKQQATPAAAEPKAGSFLASQTLLILAAMAIFLTLLGVGLAFHWHSVQRQAEAVAMIHACGGDCYYDFQTVTIGPESGGDDTAVSPVPAWLLYRLGPDFFHSVTMADMLVGLGSSDNADVRWMLEFPKLRSISLHGHVSDVALAYIGQLSDLESVYVQDGDEVTDAGVAQLANLRKLKFLQLSHSQIGDESLRILAALPQLSCLDLIHNHLTDRGLAYLASMTQLEYLWIGVPAGGCEITDEGVSHLKGLVNLERLDLQNTRVTMAGIEQLKDLHKLQMLNFDGAERQEDLDRIEVLFPGCRTH